jgi:NADH-quinone oxidoreductase subunit L
VIHPLIFVVVFAPLLGSMIAGFLGKVIGRTATHCTTIALMICSLAAALVIAKDVFIDGQTYNGVLYHWVLTGRYAFDIGFLIDQLTAIMLVVVTFVSLVVHIYTIGYMHDDPGYQRFFSYVSLFTFMMLMLVTANNFLQLFFGWEGVGLVSYLLIGFWFKTTAAANGSFKAFLVNRVGDMGFIIGISAILAYFGSLDYSTVFANAGTVAGLKINVFANTPWSVISLICIALFVGAMGKSAQVPLHVWLPESMAGPTPISALIHAATMVTAGIFMVARMSPLFELSPVALSLVLVIGATGALFLGLLAFVENDIKRVIAYSTMSQLGYMMAANGASAFSAGIFHLATHACFKALLFLAAGSVIIAMHHEQDIRKMGNLRKYMPITYITFLIGAWALAAIPPFSGFYSKEAIIEAVHVSTIPGSGYAYICLLLGSFATAYYIFRVFFLAFHTTERMDKHTREHLHETSWTMTLPLILLAIPSMFVGAALAQKILYSSTPLLGNSIFVAPQYDVLKKLAEEFPGIGKAMLESFAHLPLWFALAGVLVSWLACVKAPVIRSALSKQLSALQRILIAKYGFDTFYQKVIVSGIRGLSEFFYRWSDKKIIDATMVDGSGHIVSRVSRRLRRMQTGYLYHYAFVMMLGLLALLCWFLF